MYITVITLPIITSIILIIWSRKIGIEGTKKITKRIYSICLILSYLIMNEIKNTNIEIIIKLPWKWIETLIWNINIELYYDKKSIIMLCLIYSISTIVLYFSIWYLEKDPNIIKFLISIQIFTISMVLLVLSNNLLILFIGWEMMGILSYILINYWDTSIESNKSAMKAILYNRIGDISLILFILWILKKENFISFNIWNECISDNYILIFVIIASMVKSALFPFHGWLVSAMQGPTPVSALLHAATMVTAGIFLLIRVKDFFIEDIFIIIMIIGTITLFLGSLSSLFLYDIKKIIALSTCSQIGYMYLSIGFQQYNLSLFHLFTHGFFKALLFICSGILIHSLFNEQDFRKFGSFIYSSNNTYIFMFIGCFSLLSFPYLSGFYSKESILINSLLYFPFIYFLTYFSAIITCYYSLRLLYLIFLSKPRSSKLIYFNIHDGPNHIFYSLLLLISGSIFFGWFFKDYLIGFGIILNYAEFFFFSYNSLFLFLFPILIPIFSIFLLRNILPIISLFNRRFYIESLINMLIIKIINLISNLFLKIFDSGYFEYWNSISFYRNFYLYFRFNFNNLFFFFWFFFSFFLFLFL